MIEEIREKLWPWHRTTPLFRAYKAQPGGIPEHRRVEFHRCRIELACRSHDLAARALDQLGRHAEAEQHRRAAAAIRNEVEIP